MEKCIYTKKTRKHASFESAEHIFPRCIGGIRKLEKGYVSDEFNNAISDAEKYFSQEYPLVLLPRMMYGPRGRKSHHGKSNLSFLKSVEDEFIQLGYIEDGTPHPIPQVIVQVIPKKEGTLIESLQGIITQKGGEKTLLKDLSQYADSVRCLKTDDPLMKNKICIGIVKKQAYLGLHETMSEDEARRYMKTTIELVRNDRVKISDDVSIEYVKQQVKYQKKLAFIVSAVQRVYAKIAFNTLAYLKGQDFVLREEFDSIRKAILTGNDISNFVSMPDVECSREIAKTLRFENNEHFAFLKKEATELCGVIVLYGGSSSVMVRLAKNWNENFEACGFVCDWMNAKELSLDDYILQLYFESAGCFK